MDAIMTELNASMPFDVRLWHEDITGSIAYAHAAALAGIITPEEADHIVTGLQAIHDEFAKDAFAVHSDDEDIHTAVERRLRELIGEAAGKLNDQIATDIRLFVIEAIVHLQKQVIDLQEVLINQASANVTTYMPGYTHLQRAQPITFAHLCMAYFWMLARDVDRLIDCSRRTAVLPLGSGALAGNPFAIDRLALAAELGFTAVSMNSLDGVSDRDFVAELLFCCSMIGNHLSRIAEDLVIYSTAEFGFVTFDDAYSTGSSLMPQKKNPDAMELTRGKSGRLTGNLVTLLTVIKGLPMTYNKDLQEDKEPLFDSLDTLNITLPVVAAAIRTLRVNTHRMSAALDPAMLATDIAEYLVRKGLPFRDAHHVSGRAVALAEQKSVTLSMLSDEDWRGLSPHFETDVHAVFNFAQSVASRDVTGGTSPRALREQLDAAAGWLKDHA